ncbi:hypothetical protein SAMN05444397_102242 [Flavobacterium aquidurense]|uniref:Type II CBASS E2 protein domain-containing protein n=1 Tax=Flavobacterium frigidimaris TaxID=262320 RepID=A0ABX4BQV0_FLAFR|nr:hypothetical protein [Flavobacterium frigidimaris]OXA79012.1 hypothetical protein B0A65_10685 [Flavobacterium frigidimaris]SDY78413.1 hypothetical protein SAMN05444397_102242 [Flavobacterium aquidurense]
MNNHYHKREQTKTRNGFSSSAQLLKIKEMFPNIEVVKEKGNSFEIKFKIQPTTLSQFYDVKLTYDKFTGVKVYVLSENLAIAKNRTKLPHVYSSKDQRLCLYSPSKNEWTKEKFIVSTIIPWISKWFFFYEIWLIDGEWLGGGHNEYEVK